MTGAWNWEFFYLVCFGLGLVFTVLSFAGGAFHLHGGHVHLGSHGHGFGVKGGHHGGSVPAVNGFTVTAFLCWFGGVGYLLHHYSSMLVPMVLLIAVASGMAGAGVIFWFLAKVLLPHESELTAEDTQVVGVVGSVIGPIEAGRTGEILFSQGGVRRAVPARSEAGERIPRGAEVIVVRYERGVAQVRQWDAMEFESLLSADKKLQ